MITIDISDLIATSDRLKDQSAINKECNEIFKQAMGDLFQSTLAEMPRKSGQMQKATQLLYPSELSGEISVDDSRAPHAKYVFGGTRAHTVKAVNAKSLQWFNGGVNYAKSVVIPAQAPNPFLDNIYKAHESELVKYIEDEVTQFLSDEVL